MRVGWVGGSACAAKEASNLKNRKQNLIFLQKKESQSVFIEVFQTLLVRKTMFFCLFF